MTEIRHLNIGGDRSLAYRHRSGRGPTLLFLPGYMSDMEGGKATALDAWAEGQGRAMLRFDYAGCGGSEGDFGAQTLGGWRDDVRSEEHTSELQSLMRISYAVFCLKKKNTTCI